MRRLLLKNVHSTGGVCLANPAASPGKQNGECTVTRIENIPDGIENSTVARTWSQTANLSWLGSEDPLAGGRFVFDWSEIGPGRIVR